MIRKDRYANRARVSTWQLRQLVRYFALGSTVSQMALLTGLNRKTGSRYRVFFRYASRNFVKRSRRLVGGEVEVDESFFGARRIKGKQGRGGSGNTIVFGIFQRNGQVYTELVPDCRKSTLQAVIRGKVALDSVIYSDGWRGIMGWLMWGTVNIFGAHVDGIEGSWGTRKPGSSVSAGSLNKHSTCT